MQQGWLSVGGLALDAIGFSMIAWQWLKQWRWQHENFWVDLVRNYYDNLRPGMRVPTAYMDNYRQIFLRRMPEYTWLETAEEKDVMWVTQSHDQLHTDAHLKDSKRTFILGLGLVIFGFFLQGVGSVPGGIPALRIYPNMSLPAPPETQFAEPDRLPPHQLIPRHRYRRAWPSVTK